MRQHVVSQVLLRRWTDGSGLLRAHDLRYDTTKITGTAGEGYIEGFISRHPQEAENRWGRYEAAMPAVFDALDRGDLFERVDLLNALKDFLALHFARSRTLREMFTRSRGQSEPLEEILRAANDTDFLAGYFQERFGLEPAGPAALLIAKDAIHEMVKDRFGDGGPFFEEQIEQHFATVQELARSEWSIQIGTTQEAEFLIGDDPVQVVDHDRGLIGVLSGVSIGSADTLLMPLGPRHVLAIAKSDESIELGPSAVARVNRVQTVSAQEKVYYRRDAPLTDWVSNLVATEPTRARGDPTKNDR